MNYPLFFTVAALLCGISVWIGKRASRGVRTEEDYFLMGRNLPFLPLFLTLLATQLGGGSLLGASQEAYQKGWAVLFYPLGMCFGFFALAAGFGAKLRRLNISTVAEIFEKIYGSRLQRKMASLLSIAALYFILVAQGIAARQFFASMGAGQPLIFIAFWSVLVAYTAMGGLKAVVNTDILQALFIIGTLLLAYLTADFSAAPQASFEQGGSEIPWCAWLFMPFLFMLIEQDMGQRCFAAKSPRTVTLSAIAAGIVLFLSSAVAVYFGVAARKIGIAVPEGSSVLIEAISSLTNPSVASLFMAAIFMAVISTADSLLCSISSNLSYDFLSVKKVGTSQLLTLAAGISALLFAFLFDNVVAVLMLSYELSVCILFVPIAAAVLLKNPSRRGAYFSMASGLSGFILFRLTEFSIPGEALTVLLSFCGYFAGSMIPARRRAVA